MIEKETYFFNENIDKKSFEIYKQVQNILNCSKTQKFNPETSALIVVDMQNFFCSTESRAYIPSSPAIIPRIKLLINNYKSNNLPVYFTRHANTHENAGMMGKWWQQIIEEKDNISDIISDFDVESYELITKTQYDAFFNTNLEELLKEKRISQLVITGVATNLCCESTARSAFARGFETFIPIDCTAAYNEIIHVSSLLNLRHGFSYLSFSEELCKEFKQLITYET